MPEEPSIPSDSDLKLEREAVRRGLSRSRGAAIAVLLIATLLGAAAVMAALRAERHANESHERLWESLISQARAERLSGEVGSRTKALKAIREAAAIRPTSQLRDEAIAALALIDLQPLDEWSGFSERADMQIFSPDLTYYALLENRRISVIKTGDRTEVTQFKVAHSSFEQLLFSPDETLLAGYCNCGEFIVWSVEDQRELWRDRNPGQTARIFGLSFDSAGDQLAVAAPLDGEIRIFEAKTGEERERVEALGVNAIALTPDGRHLAWCAGTILSVTNLKERDEPVLKFTLPSGGTVLA